MSSARVAAHPDTVALSVRERRLAGSCPARTALGWLSAGGLSLVAPRVGWSVGRTQSARILHVDFCTVSVFEALSGNGKRFHSRQRGAHDTHSANMNMNMNPRFIIRIYLLPSPRAFPYLSPQLRSDSALKTQKLPTHMPHLTVQRTYPCRIAWRSTGQTHIASTNVRKSQIVNRPRLHSLSPQDLPLSRPPK